MVEVFRNIAPQLVLDEPMSKHTSFRIGGAADMFVSAESEEQIAALAAAAAAEGVPFTVMGNGSNMLVGDSGIRGMVVQVYKGMAECRIDGTRVYAQAGVLLSKLASQLAAAGLSGFETLSGIPGTLGGAIFMNAGAYGGEIKDVIKSVRYIDENGEIKSISGTDCGFGYRTSCFERSGRMIILSAELELCFGSETEIREAMSDYNKRRSDKQPLDLPSAGSTFKRPEGYFAGKLIEDAGLSGYSVGGAQVSTKHAGFVVNRGGATAADVLTLIGDVQRTVKEKYGVDLEPEIRLTGEQ